MPTRQSIQLIHELIWKNEISIKSRRCVPDCKGILSAIAQV